MPFLPREIICISQQFTISFLQILASWACQQASPTCSYICKKQPGRSACRFWFLETSLALMWHETFLLCIVFSQKNGKTFCVATFLRFLVGTCNRAHMHKLASNVYSWLWSCWWTINLPEIVYQRLLILWEQEGFVFVLRFLNSNTQDCGL